MNQSSKILGRGLEHFLHQIAKSVMLGNCQSTNNKKEEQKYKIK